MIPVRRKSSTWIRGGLPVNWRDFILLVIVWRCRIAVKVLACQSWRRWLAAFPRLSQPEEHRTILWRMAGEFDCRARKLNRRMSGGCPARRWNSMWISATFVRLCAGRLKIVDNFSKKAEQLRRLWRDRFTWQETQQRMARRIETLVHPSVADIIENRRADLTVCVAAKDVERDLADCLARVRPFVKLIVFVDLGSTDKTPEIAAEYGAKVVTVDAIPSDLELDDIVKQQMATDWYFWLKPEHRIAESDMLEVCRQVRQQWNSNESFDVNLPIDGTSQASISPETIQVINRANAHTSESSSENKIDRRASDFHLQHDGQTAWIFGKGPGIDRFPMESAGPLRICINESVLLWCPTHVLLRPR